ncbi:ubiquitin-associated domain-containing protein 2-like [Gastrophryne carolinensis]
MDYSLKSVLGLQGLSLQRLGHGDGNLFEDPTMDILTEERKPTGLQGSGTNHEAHIFHWQELQRHVYLAQFPSPLKSFMHLSPALNLKDMYRHSVQAIKEHFNIWRLFSGRIICLDLKDTFCSSLLIYNFRTLERRFGTRKFTSCLLASWLLSALFDLLVVEAVRLVGDVSINALPSGFLAPVFALFVPFYCSVPQVSLAHIFGWFPVTNKTLVYIVGLQEICWSHLYI